MNKLLNLIALLATTLLLACGGGGGGGDGGTVPPPPVPSDPSAAQGFWSGQVNAQTTASAVLLPDGTAWNVLRTGAAINSLVRGTTTVSGTAFSISGQSFNIAGGAPAGYSISGTLAPKATLTVAAAQGAPGYTLAYNKSYETAAKLSDVAGRWNASFGGGALQLALDFSAGGALTGSSSTGCTYSGSVVPHPAGIAVFNLSLTETCAGTPAQQFAGIATLNEARTQLSAAFTTPSLSAGGLFLATR